MKKLIQLLLVITFLIAFSCILIHYAATVRSSAVNIKTLPVWGEYFPVIEDSDVDYVFHRVYNTLYAKTKISYGGYVNILDGLELDINKTYEKRSQTPYLFEEIDDEFKPSKNNVKFSFGSLKNGGRKTIKLYYEEVSSSAGNLYIHIN